jgi:hypothetical protein
MEKKYISVDVETSGATPGKYSMLSLGACVVGETSKQFYKEIKPLNHNYNPEAMKVACLGLNCLKQLGYRKEHDPKSPDFSPIDILQTLEDTAVPPKKAMTDFKDWVVSVIQGYRPVLAARPTMFDGMFIVWYFDNFLGENPFDHSGEDINSMYRGYTGDIYTNIDRIKLEGKAKHTHNALDDAIEQALKLEHVLMMMKKSGEHLKPIF